VITEEQCVMVHHIVVDSGAAAMFDNHMRGPGGPRPSFPRSLLLIGWLLSVLTYRRSHLRTIHRILLEEVPIQWQEKWGVRWDEVAPSGTRHQCHINEGNLQEISKRVRARYNYSTNFITDEPAKGIFRGDIRQANEAALNELIDCLVRATLPPRPTGWGVSRFLDMLSLSERMGSCPRRDGSFPSSSRLRRCSL
jgi:hypothetical protein